MTNIIKELQEILKRVQEVDNSNLSEDQKSECYEKISRDISKLKSEAM